MVFNQSEGAHFPVYVLISYINLTDFLTQKGKVRWLNKKVITFDYAKPLLVIFRKFKPVVIFRYPAVTRFLQPTPLLIPLPRIPYLTYLSPFYYSYVHFTQGPLTRVRPRAPTLPIIPSSLTPASP